MAELPSFEGALDIMHQGAVHHKRQRLMKMKNNIVMKRRARGNTRKKTRIEWTRMRTTKTKVKLDNSLTSQLPLRLGGIA
jgi:hypothetical protein